MNGIARGGLDDALLIHRLAKHVEDAAQGCGAHRHHDRSAGRFRRQTTLQAIRGVHRHRAHPATAKVLLDLEDQRFLIRTGYLDGLIEFRDLPFGELDVDHTTKNLHYTACCVCHELFLQSFGFSAAATEPRIIACSRARALVPALDYCPNASAPPTMSRMSLVIVCWRILLYWSSYAPASSRALSVALCMATMRAACSLACDSRMAWYTCNAVKRGMISSRISRMSGSYSYAAAGPLR